MICTNCGREGHLAKDCKVPKASKFCGGDINAVLRLVTSLSGDGDVQLSILTHALVIGCKSCGVPKHRALEAVAELFEQTHELTPLNETRLS